MLDDPNAFFLYAGLVGGVLLAIFGIRAGLRRDNTEDWVKLNQLAAKGVNLEARRQVEFVLLVRTEPSAQHVAQQLLSDGFVTRFERGSYQVHRGGAVASQDEGYLLWATKSVVLYGGTVKEMRQKLSALASRENGKYLGWTALDESPLGEGT
jgi:hypothetical protein